MATIDNRFADPAGCGVRLRISEGFVILDSVIKCYSCACAVDLKLDSSLDFYNVSLF